MLIKAAENENEFRAARHGIHHHWDAKGLREMDLPGIFFLEACQADRRVDQFPCHVCQLASRKASCRRFSLWRPGDFRTA